MKEYQNELTIIKINSNENGLTTADILYNHYKIGICEFTIGNTFPNQNMNMVGAPFYTQYYYTLIFDSKPDERDISLNVALDCIQTNGFFELSSCTAPFTPSNLGLPIGLYKNIGDSPEGIRYTLELVADVTESKIFLNGIY